jgi:hypothetical protein
MNRNVGPRTRIELHEEDFRNLSAGDTVTVRVVPTGNDADYQNPFSIEIPVAWWMGKSYVKSVSWRKHGVYSFPRVTKEMQAFITTTKGVGRRKEAGAKLDIDRRTTGDRRKVSHQGRINLKLAYENIYCVAFDNINANVKMPLQGRSNYGFSEDSEVSIVMLAGTDHQWGSKKSLAEFARYMAEKGYLVDEDGNPLTEEDVQNINWAEVM